MGGYYGDGYMSKPQIERIGLPNKIKCISCKRVKNLDAYSKKSQYILKEKVHTVRTSGKPDLNLSVAEVIPCGMCTSTQVNELECGMCGKVKGLVRFAKQQRKFGTGRATCWSCMQDRLNNEPGAGSDEESSDDSNASDSKGSSDDEYSETASTLPGTMSGMTLNGSSTGGGYSTYNSTSSGGGVRLFNTNNGSVIHTTIPPSIANGANRTPPHLRNRRAPSPTNSVTSVSTATTMKSYYTENTSGGDKFAKVNAVKQRVNILLVERERAEKKAAKSGSKLDERDPDERFQVAADSDSD